MSGKALTMRKLRCCPFSLLFVTFALLLAAYMDSRSEWPMSKELAAQACDQCYRCKLRCSRTQPACHRCQGNGSACTWSMGKWLGKPQSTKRKVSDGKEHAETRGQQESRSPEKEITASRYRSQSNDELHMSEAVWSNSKPEVGGPPPSAENRTEEIYTTTLDCPSDCLQIPGESLSSEEDSFLLWPLLEMPPEKLSPPVVDEQPHRPATRTLVSPTTFQHSKNPPDRHPTTSSEQKRSERAGRQDKGGSFITKSLYSYNGTLASPSPTRRMYSGTSRAGHTTDLISPPDSFHSWERQDQPEEAKNCSDDYQSHINKPLGASCVINPTRRFLSPLPLLRTENSQGERARIFHLEDSKAVQDQTNRSRHGYHCRTQTESDMSLVGHPHALSKSPYSRHLQSPQPTCSCLLHILESLGQSDPFLLASKLLSACETSTRCKSCYNDELALLQRLMSLQKVYTCLYLLHKDIERYSRPRSPRAGLRDRHGEKQAGQASLMEDYNWSSGDAELDDRQNPPGEVGRDCTLNIAEDVRMLLFRAVTLVSHEEMLSISCRPRFAEIYSVVDSVLSFGSQFSILLKKFRALLGLESG